MIDVAGSSRAGFRVMWVLVSCFVLNSMLALSQAETLRELLAANRIPSARFSQAELNVPVQGSAQGDDRRVVLMYRLLKGELFFGRPKLTSYDRNSGRVLRSELSIDNSDVCAGAPASISFIGEFALLSIDITPSAQCLIVVDKDLKQRQILYGFGPVEITPEQVVIMEDQIHFAPVHPGRLQFADLKTGKTTELYPPKGDVARAELAKANGQHMPSRDTCAQMNDPCEPEQFNEDILSLVTNGKDGLAFIASQYADHAIKAEEPPETVASQLVLYIYQRGRDGWRYCEQKIDDSEKSAVERWLEVDYEKGALRCKPALPVIPDLSTAGYNPFMKP